MVPLVKLPMVPLGNPEQSHCLAHVISFSFFGSVRGSPNGTIGNFTNGTIGSQWYHWLTNGTNGTIGKPMVPLTLPLVPMVKPIVSLVEP